MTSLSSVLDDQVLAAHCAYLEETGRAHFMAIWRLGQSSLVLRRLQDEAAGYYEAARRCRWELIRRRAP